MSPFSKVPLARQRHFKPWFECASLNELEVCPYRSGDYRERRDGAGDNVDDGLDIVERACVAAVVGLS